MAERFDNDWLRRFETRQMLAKASLQSATASVAATPESHLQDDIANECRRRGWLPVYSRMDQRTSNAPGTADFIIYADDGRMFHVEAKTKTGKLSLEQMAFGAHLKKLGHEYHVVRSFAEFLAVITPNQKTNE